MVWCSPSTVATTTRARMTLVGDTGLNLGAVSKIDGSAFASMVYDPETRAAGSGPQASPGRMASSISRSTHLTPFTEPMSSGQDRRHCRVPVPGMTGSPR